VGRVRVLGCNALREFAIRPQSMKLLVHAENTTFKVVSNGQAFCLRVQRPGYQTLESTQSELLFLEHLRGLNLPVPEPVHAADGRLIVTAAAPGLAEPRNCELFRWISGRFFRRTYGPAQTRAAGRLMARLHLAALEFKPPESFTRRRLDDKGLFRPEDDVVPGQSPLLNADRCRRISKLMQEARQAMKELGTSSEVFGLIHADLHAGNLVWHGGAPQAIDFDDTGWGHYAYDFAAALAFGLGLDRFPQMRDAMLEGYEEIAPLPPRTRELLPSFIRVRYYELTRWVAQRQDNPYFREHGDALITRWLERVEKL
jgi:Ser/Thr protein kinase RdoA (MazF antagonist)